MKKRQIYCAALVILMGNKLSQYAGEHRLAIESLQSSVRLKISTTMCSSKGFDVVKEVAVEETEEKSIEKNVTTPKSSSVKEVMTEEDLEDWLDSMIS